MTQSASNATSNVTDDFTPIYGIGARYCFSDRHSIFFDVERYEREPDYNPYVVFNDLFLSREPLYENPNNELVLYPLTLGYGYALLPSSSARLTPHVFVGLCAARHGSQKITDSRFPQLEISSDESITSSGADEHWKIGAIIGIGWSVRVNSWLSLDGTASYRHLDLPKAGSYALRSRADTHQNNNGIVFEGTDYDQNPVRARTGGFEGKLILEFRL